MRKEVPEGVLEMLAIPGLRPEKALKLHQELGISSLEELQAAARQDRLKNVKGFGAALQAKILQGIDIRGRAEGQRHIHRAAELLKAAEANLKKSKPGIRRIQPAGDFRRGCELVSELSLVAEVPRTKVNSNSVFAEGELKIHTSDVAHYGATLLRATGSEAHLDQLRAYAKSKGYSLDPDGLYKRGKLVAATSEQAIYAKLGLAFIEPELREGRGEVRMAEAGELPTLVADSDVRGILQAHTKRSDGLHTLEQMANATRKQGYSYFGVADHSKSAQYAGGLSIEEIAEQRAEADRLNVRYGASFRILKGIESDILADGLLDYPDDVMDRFDFVVASVHSRFRMDPREGTSWRVADAIERNAQRDRTPSRVGVETIAIAQSARRAWQRIGRNAAMSTNADASVKISIEQLAAKLPDVERLRITQALVAAAYALCPKECGGNYPDPSAVKLATLMNGAVTSLLVTAAEKRRAECFDAMCERRHSIKLTLPGSERASLYYGSMWRGYFLQWDQSSRYGAALITAWQNYLGAGA
jgi:DNA polymerase/3'-5' exonuclease PolX